GGSNPSGRSYSTGSKPTGSYDTAAGRASQRAESRAAYQKSTSPAPTYTDSRGTARPIDPQDPKIETLRRGLDHDRWGNRQERQRAFYGPTIWTTPSVVYYHDPYSNFFWTWMLMQSLDNQAYWAYHHRYAMDSARYDYLMNNNAELRARVAALEAKQVPRD